MSDIDPSKRTTFDDVASLYDRIRPGYPDEMYADIIRFSRIPPGGAIFEMGCGTGQATLPFARLGYQIRCIELGERLAQAAREKLADFPKVRIMTGDFEVIPIEENIFDLAISGTAFHWINPEVGYPKLARLLKPGGSIALFWNKHVYHPAGNAFFKAVQKVYLSEVPEIAQEDFEPPLPEQVPETTRGEIERSGLFGPVSVLKYPWEAVYSAQEYVDLLDTYSDHHSLEGQTRARLYQGIARLINDQFGGQITKGYLAIVFIARRL